MMRFHEFAFEEASQLKVKRVAGNKVSGDGFELDLSELDIEQDETDGKIKVKPKPKQTNSANNANDPKNLIKPGSTIEFGE